MVNAQVHECVATIGEDFSKTNTFFKWEVCTENKHKYSFYVVISGLIIYCLFSALLPYSSFSEKTCSPLAPQLFLPLVSPKSLFTFSISLPYPGLWTSPFFFPLHCLPCRNSQFAPQRGHFHSFPPFHLLK